jgi:microcystin-dependent protein
MAESLMGEIQAFGFSYAPQSWAQCWGQIMPIRQYTAMFSLLGTYYGGDGKVTFGLPDLRGRVAVGQGQGPGLTEKVIGEMGGTENVSLLLTNLPMHTHAINGGSANLMVSSQPGTQPNATDGVSTLAAFNDVNASNTNSAYNSSAPDVALSGFTPLTGTIGFTGGGTPINMMQPTLGLNYCICIEGIFPQRS